MKLSLVICVLDSHEIVKRQERYWCKIYQPDCEIVLVDDGSDPPINILWTAHIPIKIFRTYDKSQWSEHIAANIGVHHAQGEYIFKTDIDHIISKEALNVAMGFNGDYLKFKRARARLDKEGNLVDVNMGKIDYHSNTFVIKKKIFNMLGGYNEYGRGLGGGGSFDFFNRYMLYHQQGLVAPPEYSDALTYVWPNSPIYGSEDQHLFHKLRKARW